MTTPDIVDHSQRTPVYNCMMNVYAENHAAGNECGLRAHDGDGIPYMAVLPDLAMAVPELRRESLTIGSTRPSFGVRVVKTGVVFQRERAECMRWEHDRGKPTSLHSRIGIRRVCCKIMTRTPKISYMISLVIVVCSFDMSSVWIRHSERACEERKLLESQR